MYNYMRSIITLCLTFSALVCLQAQIFNVGAGAGFVFNEGNTAFGPQLRIQYNINESFNIAGSYSHYLTKDSGYAIDADLRYKLFKIGNVRFNPLGGIGYRKFGGIALNLGLVTEIPQNSFIIYIEPKFIIDETAVFALTGGVLF